MVEINHSDQMAGKSQLKCLYWNLHGIYSKILGEKNNDPDFLKIISSYDVIGISELHTKKQSQYQVSTLKNKNFEIKNIKDQKLVEELLSL